MGARLSSCMARKFRWCERTDPYSFKYDHPAKYDAECMIHNDRTQKIPLKETRKTRVVVFSGHCVTKASPQQRTSGAELVTREKNKDFGL